MESHKHNETQSESDIEQNRPLLKYLSTLIPSQIELGKEAVKRQDGELASLAACQMFDLLDWARINLDSNMGILSEMILADLKSLPIQLQSLQQLEDYVEITFVEKFREQTSI